MARKSNNHITTPLVIVGAGVVGAGLGLLFAPKSGRKTRKDIVRFAKNVGTRTDKIAHEFADDFTDFADTMGHKASKLLHEGRDMTRKSKEILLTAFESGQARLENQKNKLQRMISRK
ncbi:MAG: YtxH domain-containing protein [Geobacteraceae bacterium]